jgi:hypothetical protein
MEDSSLQIPWEMYLILLNFFTKTKLFFIQNWEKKKKVYLVDVWRNKYSVGTNPRYVEDKLEAVFKMGVKWTWFFYRFYQF